jgi:20S proteasome subunit alpha 7
MSALASRLGGYVQAYTLYSSVRPFGISAIVGGWDSEAEMPVDGQVGEGPNGGAGGKASFGEHDVRRGGPGLYMIEPSGLYWVSYSGCEAA